MTDPDGKWAMLAVNAFFGGVSAYQAYNSGKSWKGIAAAGALGFVGGGRIKGGRYMVGAYKQFIGKAKAKIKGREGHHIIQDAAVRGLPGYNKRKAPVVGVSSAF